MKFFRADQTGPVLLSLLTAAVLGALLVSLDVLASQPEWRKNSWMYEIHAVTDGQSVPSLYRRRIHSDGFDRLLFLGSLTSLLVSWYGLFVGRAGESEFGDDLLDDLKAKLPKVPAVTIVV